MVSYVSLHSNTKGEINNFLSRFYSTDINLYDSLDWKKEYKNPIELCEIIGAFIDNFEDFSIRMWICLDKHVFILVSKHNGNQIIQYLYERFPY